MRGPGINRRRLTWRTSVWSTRLRLNIWRISGGVILNWLTFLRTSVAGSSRFRLRRTSGNVDQPKVMNEGDKDMQSRIDIQKAVPAAFQAMLGLEAYARRAWHAEPLLLGLVKMRASQLNGCAYCIDMHTKDARAHGETEQRLYLLNAWRETPFYSARERAALEWTEHLTLIATKGVPDDLYERV